MSNTTIPVKTKNLLWALAAGRCQYKNCNDPLHQDLLTKKRMNKSYVAHIIADEPGGPRGCPLNSPLLKKDLSNLMLLCDTHHRLVDVEAVSEHPVHILQTMKYEHEMRISKQTNVTEDSRSHLLLYGSNIGEHNPLINGRDTSAAISPKKYPEKILEIGLKNNASKDNEADFWKIEIQNLRRLYRTNVLNLLAHDQVKHLSVFAVAPQPLLIELGRLIGDLQPADIYQRRREPSTWQWDEQNHTNEYKILKPSKLQKKIALNVSLSANISEERILKVTGPETSIWTVTINNPNNDFLHSENQLAEFRKIMRALLDEIKLKHGEDAELHVFPAMPVSTAIELGRVWMPKAHLPMIIYDQNSSLGGFVHAHTVENSLLTQELYV